MQQNDSLKNIWELYGVNEDPFSTSPLLVIGGSIPIESFVGRGDEIKRLSKIIGSKGGSRTFVYGDIGVGKTSFVNVVRNSAFENGHFTHFKEITTQDKWDSDDFVLNTLSAIYSSLKVIKDKKKYISDKIYIKLASLFEVNRTVTNSFGTQVLGVGVNYGNEHKSAEILPSFSLQELFVEVIKEINTTTKKDIIIHYNNLELISESKVKHLFNTLRDFFNSLSTAIFYVTNESPVILDRNRLSKVLKDILEKRFLNNLTPAMRKVLNKIVKHEENTNRALSDRLKIPRSNISSYIKDLERAGCVYLKRKNGKDKFWKADPKIRWSLLKEDPQQRLKTA